MVLENLYAKDFLKKHLPIAFIVAAAYSVFAIAGSAMLFRDHSPSTVAVGLISLFLLTTFKDIIDFDRKAVLDWKAVLLFLYIFAGVMFTFCLFAMVLPGIGASFLFDSQYSYFATGDAQDLFSFGTARGYLLNNLAVLTICLLTSILFGIWTFFLFIIVWNASVFGVVFGAVARESAAASSFNPLVILGVIFLAALPHLVLEVIAYLLSGIGGEHISFKIENKQGSWKHALKLIGIAALLLIAAALLESYWAPFAIEMLL